MSLKELKMVVGANGVAGLSVPQTADPLGISGLETTI